MTMTEMITTLHLSLKMKFQASRFLLLQLFLLSTCCCDKAQSFALSPHHYSLISRRHRHHHHHARQFRIDIAPLPTPSSMATTTTALKYRSDSDLPEDSSSSQPTILPVPLAKKKATKAKTSRNSRSENKIEAAQNQKERQQNRPPPVRRSFLHQLDRFLTELQGADDHLRRNTFLTGNFAPVSKEHVSLPVEVVEGTIPSNLNGAFCRNGPNPIRDVQKKRYHWFDGHAMLHTLMFKNGDVKYTNQFIPSPRFSIEQELGEEYFPTIGEYKGMLGLMKLMFHAKLVKEKIKDLKTVAPPNTNIMMYNKKLYCLHEANLPMECRMHPDGRLEYVGYETFGGVLDYPVSAHPVRDGNDLLFHSYSVDEELIKEHGTMKVGRYNSQTSSVDTYLVPTPTKTHVSFAHSLIHTDNYIIVWDCSVHFRTDALFMGGSFFRNIHDFTLKFGLIPKDATSREDVIWIDSGEVGAIVHPLHAWEEVVVDELGEARIVINLWTPFCKDLELDLEKSNIFHMTEFKIDSHARTCTKEVIDDTINSEFAIMPPHPSQQTSSTESITDGVGIGSEQTTFLSTHERYGFTAIFGDCGSFIGWAKWDMVSRSLHSTVYYGRNESGGEPIVVRAKKQIIEDDDDDDVDTGAEEEIIYIGSYVYNEDENQSYFLIFDGETNRQVCRLKMPQRVPFGFHGQFISGEELDFHYRHHQEIDRRANLSCPIEWIRFFIRDIILDFSQQLGSAKSP